MASKKPSDLLIKLGDRARRGGPVCKTCENEHWTQEADKLIEMGCTTHKGWSLPMFHELLQQWEEHPYTLSKGALEGHLKNHRPELWRRWIGRNREKAE